MSLRIRLAIRPRGPRHHATGRFVGSVAAGICACGILGCSAVPDMNEPIALSPEPAWSTTERDIVRDVATWWNLETGSRLHVADAATDVGQTVEVSRSNLLCGFASGNYQEVSGDVAVCSLAARWPAQLSSTLAHELGHALGIRGHTKRPASLMSASTAGGGTYFSDEDRAALREAQPGFEPRSGCHRVRVIAQRSIGQGWDSGALVRDGRASIWLLSSHSGSRELLEHAQLDPATGGPRDAGNGLRFAGSLDALLVVAAPRGATLIGTTKSALTYWAQLGAGDQSFAPRRLPAIGASDRIHAAARLGHRLVVDVVREERHRLLAIDADSGRSIAFQDNPLEAERVLLAARDGRLYRMSYEGGTLRVARIQADGKISTKIAIEKASGKARASSQRGWASLTTTRSGFAAVLFSSAAKLELRAYADRAKELHLLRRGELALPAESATTSASPWYVEAVVEIGDRLAVAMSGKPSRALSRELYVAFIDAASLQPVAAWKRISPPDHLDALHGASLVAGRNRLYALWIEGPRDYGSIYLPHRLVSRCVDLP